MICYNESVSPVGWDSVLWRAWVLRLWLRRFACLLTPAPFSGMLELPGKGTDHHAASQGPLICRACKQSTACIFLHSPARQTLCSMVAFMVQDSKRVPLCSQWVILASHGAILSHSYGSRLAPQREAFTSQEHNWQKRMQGRSLSFGGKCWGFWFCSAHTTPNHRVQA